MFYILQRNREYQKRGYRYGTALRTLRQKICRSLKVVWYNRIMKEHIIHPIPPFFDKGSRILILGSFPSVRSREQQFFYGHPQNRFWKVMARVFDDKVPDTIAEKKSFLSGHRIALWDVIGACDIKGSSDSSIENVTPNDLTKILGTARINGVFVNGKTAEKYYRKYTESKTGIKAVCLPSTSPANAAWDIEKLVSVWREEILKSIGR